MKKLELIQMENLDGGRCTKTTTKILVGVAAATIGVATGGLGALLFVAWDLYQIADTMGSGECQDW